MAGRRRTSATPDLFGAPAVVGPDGFAYQADVLTEAQERTFVAEFERLPFTPFEFHGYQGNRRIVSFGFGYDYNTESLVEADPMPAFLGALRDAASRFSGVPADALVQALVTEYAPGAGIGWHRDRPTYEEIVALSFGACCTLRFRKRDGKSWLRHSLDVAPRSAYLLRGPAREAWEHSIPAVDRLRYSVTFRNFRTQP
jgi:alkylated DNA repair dioxygenase AlkB